MVKKVMIYLSLVIVVCFILFLLFAPAVVEKSLNVISGSYEYDQVSDQAKLLHERLIVADLHADSLLFNRNLLKEESYGHVDVPRLIKGNVALQVFTVVTKVPMGKNIDHTDAQALDQITFLAMLQQWPVSTWFSLKERALYQASKLHDFAQRSNGLLTVIRTRADLEQYLAERENNTSMTSGILGLEGAHALEGEISNVEVLFEYGYRIMLQPFP